jgi:hypothetical protein
MVVGPQSPKSESDRDTPVAGTDNYRAMLAIVQEDATMGLPSGLRETRIARPSMFG